MNNQSIKSKTKEKIIRVAMEIIVSEGFHGITVRKIAEKAEVNVAAVNYYFGSKENLISEAFTYLTVQLKETFNILTSDNQNPEKLLHDFIYNYISVIADYPDMIKSLITYMVKEKPMQGHIEYSEFLQKEGVALISGTIKKIVPQIDELTLSLKTLNLLSSLSMPYLMGNSIYSMLSVNIFEESVKEVYVELLLENIKAYKN